jgi:hypothetical protein
MSEENVQTNAFEANLINIQSEIKKFGFLKIRFLIFGIHFLNFSN